MLFPFLRTAASVAYRSGPDCDTTNPLHQNIGQQFSVFSCSRYYTPSSLGQIKNPGARKKIPRRDQPCSVQICQSSCHFFSSLSATACARRRLLGNRHAASAENRVTKQTKREYVQPPPSKQSHASYIVGIHLVSAQAIHCQGQSTS